MAESSCANSQKQISWKKQKVINVDSVKPAPSNTKTRIYRFYS